jgi:hypothetical protein
VRVYFCLGTYIAAKTGGVEDLNQSIQKLGNFSFMKVPFNYQKLNYWRLRRFNRRENMVHFKSVSVACRVFSVAVFLSVCATLCNAASISYGDFGPVAPGVRFNDVTESSGTDAVPLYGAPTPFSVGLDFDPTSFVAFAGAGGLDLTDGQLNFDIKSDSNLVGISGLNLSEAGDYTLFGNGTNATQALAGAIMRVTVTEIDGFAVAPIDLFASNASIAFNLISNSGVVQPWSLGLFLNIAAQLNSLGISFKAGATEVEVSIDNQLLASSEANTLAFIAKKDFRIDLAPNIIPEPTSTTLLGVGLIVMAVCFHLRRRSPRV